MSNKGLIIVNQEVGHNAYKIKRFLDEFSQIGIDLEVFTNDGTLAEISHGEVVLHLPPYDFALYLDKDIYLARLLEKAGTRLFNQADFIKMCDDKVLTFIRCANENIPMPETFAGPLVYTSSINPNLDFLDNVIKELGFPLVVKKVYGSLGEGVFLVHDKKELIELYLNICHSPILFQKYIPSAKGKSVRVLIIDGQVFGCFARTNSGDFRSNYGSTAGGEIIEHPDKYIQLGQQIAEKLNIEYAGIDLLDDEDGNPILCEINSNAFFEEFEKVTGLNVAKAVALMVKKKMKYE